MTKKELREYLRDLVDRETQGSIRAWADRNKISFSYVASVIRGDAPAGKKILKAMGLRKSFSAKKTTVMRFENI